MICMRIDINPLIQLLLVLIVYVLNLDILTSGIKSLINLNPNMNALVSISSITSLIYSILNTLLFKQGHSFFDTAAMILSIVAIGKYIEKGTKSKATSILRGLSTLIPMQTNLKKENGQIEIIPISELKKGKKLVGTPICSDGEDSETVENAFSDDFTQEFKLL